MIAPLQVICLGLAQLISWGISYYLIGTFAEAIGTEHGWSMDTVFGGFASALIVMGLTSALTGKLIDTFGGRWIMIAGAFLTAGACAGLAMANSLSGYYASWLVLGVAMRLSLYDAAFAALVRMAGPGARKPIAQITLLGGFASTVFWPVGHYLTELFGLKPALLCYCAFALCNIPLYLVALRPMKRSQPKSARCGEGRTDAGAAPIVKSPVLPAILYAVIVASTNTLSAGLTSHLIGILGGLDIAATSAVWIASLPGMAQSLARLINLVLGRNLHPLNLNLLAATIMPAAFVVGFFSGQFLAAATIFVALFGAANGLLTISRGSLPLVLFDNRHYGRLVGKLITPSFFLSAASPLLYAVVIQRSGAIWALVLSFGLASIIFAAAISLKLLHGETNTTAAVPVAER